MSDITIPSGDTAPSITGLITRAAGGPLNLSAADAVHFIMRLLTDRRMIVDGEANVPDAANGAVSYDWQPGDLQTAGDYGVRWRIFWADGTVQDTTPENTLTVEPV